MRKKFWQTDLQLFADGGEPAAAGEQGADAGLQAQQDAQTRGRAQAGKEKQSFHQLLKTDPDYKKAYDERVKKAIDGRFKQQQDVKPILELLGKRYGIAADEKGDVDLRALRARLEAEAPGSRQEQTRRQADFAELVRQARAARQVYPGFDLHAELRNPAFGRLVARGVDAKTAYEAAHRDEILGAAMRYAVARAQEKFSSAVRSGAARPAEYGLSGMTAAEQTVDPARLTKTERAALRSRVARGERVVW